MGIIKIIVPTTAQQLNYPRNVPCGSEVIRPEGEAQRAVVEGSFVLHNAKKVSNILRHAKRWILKDWAIKLLSNRTGRFVVDDLYHLTSTGISLDRMGENRPKIY